MDQVIAWATFAGAWLLVAGPLYQGSAELGQLDVDRERIQGKASAAQAAQARPSPWWWLLPPVMYVLHRRWYKALQQAHRRGTGQQRTRVPVATHRPATQWLNLLRLNSPMAQTR